MATWRMSVFRVRGLGGRGSETESCTDRYSSQFENNSFTEMCSGSKAGLYLRRIDFVYHSTLGVRLIQKKRFYRSRG